MKARAAAGDINSQITLGEAYLNGNHNLGINAN